MRRTLVVLTIVMLAVLLLATPALAAGSQNRHGLRGGGGGQGSTSFNLLGTIDSYSCGDEGYISVYKSWPGTGSVTVYLTDGTLYKQCTGIPGEGDDITCNALEVGAEVRIIGKKVDGTFVATRVIQYTPPAE